LVRSLLASLSLSSSSSRWRRRRRRLLLLLRRLLDRSLRPASAPTGGASAGRAGAVPLSAVQQAASGAPSTFPMRPYTTLGLAPRSLPGTGIGISHEIGC